ncbi:MAG TPA: 5-(carboxyamino)imidazole ribonucleotide mutase [Candidatus Omnitrophota bacterium]|nr:5-(carboxyamino)imidazole ribonucleotide mutase [Candidatus Omnitrophota bacterium]
MGKVHVAILMGSSSDADVMREAANVLKEFGVSHEMKVLSAHRSPKETAEYAEKFRKEGGKIFICGAGVSAALAGVVSAHTTLPVIGVPVDSGALQGFDALLSTVQMPPGVPVAAVAIGKPGAKNAGLLAVRILSLSDEKLVKKLDDYREEQRQKILKTDIH